MSNIMDILGQLGAGGAGGPGAALGASGQGDPGSFGPDPTQAQPDPSQNPGQSDQGSGDPLELLKKMIEDGKQFMSVAPNQSDGAIVAKCLSALQSLLAQDEKETDAAMGGQVSPRQMRKAAGGLSAADSAGAAPGGSY